ncbi:DegT/DnrJ/EryC1/StrS family aminotransferase [Candidatus Peregrinibacteria bacterium]|nr:DegT/DnrJ/EryC1/StrS family aminotransferase [Candidatus Peregrinibacteria bacterium]
MSPQKKNRPSHQESPESFIVFGAPQIEQDEIDEMIATLKSGWIGTGPKVQQFEQAMRVYKNAEYTAAVSSCTSAMHLSMIAAGIGPGDEVIAPAMTFCSTINAILHAGATPVLADIDPRTMNIDPKDMARKITKRTRGFLPVHFAGRPCEMNELMALAKKHDCKVIEDCAHAIETEYEGKKAGTFGDFGALSFYVTKNMTTGEGGMVLAKRKEDIDHIKVLALHGMSKDAWARFSDKGYKHYLVTHLGFKYNMTDMQASLGLHQLRRLEHNWQRRQHIWNRYQRELADLPITLPAEPAPDTRHAYHLFPVLIEENAGMTRDAFMEEMTKQKIGVGVHYLSIPEHPYYHDHLGWNAEDFPHARHIGQTTVSIPLSAKLTDAEVDRIIETVHQILQR